MNRSSESLAGLVQLTRWREHVPFTLPATLLGVVMAFAHQTVDFPSHGHWLAVLAANVLAVTFAFMVNDLSDASDDARDPARAARNAVTSGALAPRSGWAASSAVAGAALVLYSLTTPAALCAGALTLLLGWLYSWRAVRLKAWPVVDILSHALMLSALLVLAGYLSCAATLGRVGWVIVGAGLVSCYGQLYNQLRDYDTDRAAGLWNTAAMVGRRATRWLMRACLGLAVLVLVGTMIAGLWPAWVIFVSAASTPLLLVRRSRTDMRGAEALDLSGQVQLRFMLLATGVLLSWLTVIAVS